MAISYGYSNKTGNEMKLTEFVAMTDTIRLATNKAMDAGNEFSTPWRIIGVMTAVIETSLYQLPKAKREEQLKSLLEGIAHIERSYAKEEMKEAA